MKKIADYRKLLNVDKSIELKELKTLYRNLMKEWHPDKFQDEQERLKAEEKSKEIIEAYNFLVSIAPETLAETLPQYTQTTTTSNISDYEYKAQILKVTFADGNVYEFFGVPHVMYSKLMNSEAPARFARRNIYNAFPYRRASMA